MTVQECYEKIGADYGEVIRRLGNEERVKKFLLKMLEESSFLDLCEAVTSGNTAEAFRAAHSLKGICLNLGITPLAESSSALMESLRDGVVPDNLAALFGRVEKDYTRTLSAIRELISA